MTFGPIDIRSFSLRADRWTLELPVALDNLLFARLTRVVDIVLGRRIANGPIVWLKLLDFEPELGLGSRDRVAEVSGILTLRDVREFRAGIADDTIVVVVALEDLSVFHSLAGRSPCTGTPGRVC